MSSVIERYKGELSLNTDGWTNPRGESIINYVLVARDEALFVKSVSTGKDRHTGEYIADGLKETIEELGPLNLCAITTDNASYMKSSWNEVQYEYPLIDCIGCGSHMTNLLVEDIMGIPAIHEAFNNIKEVNKYWKESTVRWGLLQYTARKNQKKAKALQLPGKTRWQGKLLTCKSSLANKKWMEEAIVNREACLGSSPTPDQRAKYDYIRELTLCSPYWEKTQELRDILEPFLQVTIALESNKAKLSRLFSWYSWLLNQSATSRSDLLPRQEALRLIDNRFHKIYTALWLIAYLCDPVARMQRPVAIAKWQLDGMAQYLTRYYEVRGETTGKKASEVYGQLVNLKEREGAFGSEIAWQSAKEVDAITWWNALHKEQYPDLTALARHALSVAPTTGAAERNWSAFGFIHCKRRNRLLNDRVEKLIFIYWNLRMLKAVPDFPDRNNDGDAEAEGEEYDENDDEHEGDDEEDLYAVDQDFF
jgi:Protein of unknown function (DUF 659)/hAT family C-terminal dimerisation region